MTTFTNPHEVTIIFHVCGTGSITVQVEMYGLAVRNVNFINLLDKLIISVMQASRFYRTSLAIICSLGACHFG